MKTREIAIFSIFSKQDTRSYGIAESYQGYYYDYKHKILYIQQEEQYMHINIQILD